MGLRKEIILDNGIAVNYHRIERIVKVTNDKTYVTVNSYLNEEEREDNNQAFIDYTQIEKEYIENETIEEIYTYLKTLDKFKDAEDC